MMIIKILQYDKNGAIGMRYGQKIGGKNNNNKVINGKFLNTNKNKMIHMGNKFNNLIVKTISGSYSSRCHIVSLSYNSSFNNV